MKNNNDKTEKRIWIPSLRPLPRCQLLGCKKKIKEKTTIKGKPRFLQFKYCSDLHSKIDSSRYSGETLTEYKNRINKREERRKELLKQNKKTNTNKYHEPKTK